MFENDPNPSRDGFKKVLNEAVRNGIKFVLQKAPQIVQICKVRALTFVTEHLLYVFDDIQIG